MATLTVEDGVAQGRDRAGAMKKSGYLQKQKATVGAYRQAEKETYIQFMTDTLILTLNDPEIMGKDVFGRQRIRRVVEAWGRVYDKYHGALEKGDEQDYHQVKMDEALMRVLGEEGFVPFKKRYDWIREAK